MSTDPDRRMFVNNMGLCAENTLEETRKLVREKLGLASDINLRLVQLRGGARVDLEDGTFPDGTIGLPRSHQI